MLFVGLFARLIYFTGLLLLKLDVIMASRWYSVLISIMATAFIGYVLPWGQMSFWGVIMITMAALREGE